MTVQRSKSCRLRAVGIGANTDRCQRPSYKPMRWSYSFHWFTTSNEIYNFCCSVVSSERSVQVSVKIILQSWSVASLFVSFLAQSSFFHVLCSTLTDLKVFHIT
jgi:hypothetical protein